VGHCDVVLVAAGSRDGGEHGRGRVTGRVEVNRPDEDGSAWAAAKACWALVGVDGGVGCACGCGA
jgi:hypothetical protein